MQDEVYVVEFREDYNENDIEFYSDRSEIVKIFSNYDAARNYCDILNNDLKYNSGVHPDHTYYTVSCTKIEKEFPKIPKKYIMFNIYPSNYLACYQIEQSLIDEDRFKKEYNGTLDEPILRKDQSVVIVIPAVRLETIEDWAGRRKEAIYKAVNALEDIRRKHNLPVKNLASSDINLPYFTEETADDIW